LWKRIYILKLDHRPERDKRITTHTALVARAFGANGFMISGVCDHSLLGKIRDTLKRWGGEMVLDCVGKPVTFLDGWKTGGGEIVHLTMYGALVDDVIDSIRMSPKDKVIVVGGPKVEPVYYELADYNVAIGNQPHSEVAALAVFLDRLFKGRELYLKHSGGSIRIIPSTRGKRVEREETEEQKRREGSTKGA